MTSGLRTRSRHRQLTARVGQELSLRLESGDVLAQFSLGETYLSLGQLERARSPGRRDANPVLRSVIWVRRFRPGCRIERIARLTE